MVQLENGLPIRLDLLIHVLALAALQKNEDRENSILDTRQVKMPAEPDAPVPH